MRALALLALAAGISEALHVTPGLGQNLYTRHNVQAAREYHRTVGNVSELFLTTPVNHFTTNNTSPQTYQMRYLIDESYVQDNDTYPAILFYCGNEGDVWTFYNNSGFMTTTLPSVLHSVVLFGEHRYYGQSKPFGAQSFTKDNVKYLTLDQTFMDYQLLISTIKQNPKYKYSPVIAFGGSYGGMLAAWMRMKFPHIIQGAHASSAPIMFFPGSVSPYAFNELVTRQWEKYRPGTKQSVYRGFMAL